MKSISYPEPSQISRSQLNRYGDEIRQGKISNEALREIDRWRASHLYPMNTFRTTLHRKIRAISGAGLAQRLKRMPTIIDKLNRFPKMELS